MIQKLLLKNLNKTGFIISFLFFNYNFSHSQQYTTPSNAQQINYIKLLCFSDLFIYSSYMTFEEYNGLLINVNRIFKADTLSSDGFKNIFFLRVIPQERDSLNLLYNELSNAGNNVSSSQYLHGSQYFVYPFLLNHEYIFAITENDIYKLKGFRINDFRSFHADCFNTGDFFSDNNIVKSSDKKILKSVSVRGLNLLQLYKENLKAGSGNQNRQGR